MLYYNVAVQCCVAVPLTRAPPASPCVSPVRVLSLLLLANSLLEADMTTLANNYFGGNLPLVHMVVDRNCF